MDPKAINKVMTSVGVLVLSFLIKETYFSAPQDEGSATSSSVAASSAPAADPIAMAPTEPAEPAKAANTKRKPASHHKAPHPSQVETQSGAAAPESDQEFRVEGIE